MKRLLISLLCLTSLASVSQALDVQLVNRSSFTLTNDSGYIAAEYLDKVIVGGASANGTIKLYNSTWTTSVQISSLTLVTAGITYHFNDLKVRGIFYTTTSNVGGVTVIYRNR